MSIEQAKVGEVAARMMERLEREYESDESAEVSSVFIISAVKHDDGEHLTVRYDSSSGMPPHEAMGLLEYVREIIRRKNIHAQ